MPISFFTNMSGLEKINIHKLPSGKRNIIKVAKRGNTVLGITDSGVIYNMNPHSLKSGCYLGWSENLSELARVCADLGVITKEEFEKWNTHTKQRAEEKRLKDKVKYTASNLISLGLPVPEKLQSLIETK